MNTKKTNVLSSSLKLQFDPVDLVVIVLCLVTAIATLIFRWPNVVLFTDIIIVLFIVVVARLQYKAKIKEEAKADRYRRFDVLRGMCSVLSHLPGLHNVTLTRLEDDCQLSIEMKVGANKWIETRKPSTLLFDIGSDKVFFLDGGPAVEGTYVLCKRSKVTKIVMKFDLSPIFALPYEEMYKAFQVFLQDLKAPLWSWCSIKIIDGAVIWG